MSRFALDYHGGGQPVPLEQMMERLMPLMGDPDRIRRLGKGGLDVLLGHDARGPQPSGGDRLLLRRDDGARARPRR